MSFSFSTFAEANAALQQQLGEANTALRAKEADCSKLAEERDRLVTQLAEQAELLKKAQKEAEDKETSLLAEFATERSAWTDKEAMLTAGFGEIEDIVDGELPSFSFFELPAAGRAGLSSLTLALCFLFWQTSSLVILTPPIRPSKLIAKDGGRKVRRLLPMPPGPLASSS